MQRFVLTSNENKIDVLEAYASMSQLCNSTRRRRCQSNCCKRSDLLTHDTQHHIDDLDRHKALTLLSEELFALLAF
jgi:hypothetical protein